MSENTTVRVSKDIALAWGHLREFIDRRPERTAPVMDAKRLLYLELPREIKNKLTKVSVGEDMRKFYYLREIRFEWPGLFILLALRVGDEGKRSIHDVTISTNHRKTKYEPQEIDKTITWKV